MRHSLFPIWILTVVVAGCNQTDSKTVLSDLKKSNTDLAAKLDAANERIEEAESRVASLQDEMEAFMQAYDDAKRSQLSRNIDSVDQMLKDLLRDSRYASATLHETQMLKAEIEELKDLCVQHEAQARDANQIDQLKTALADLRAAVNRLERTGSTSGIRGVSSGPGPRGSQGPANR